MTIPGNTSSYQEASNTNTLAWTHDNNGDLLTVSIGESRAVSLSSYTYNGVTATGIAASVSNGNSRAWILYWKNPPRGSHQVQVVFSASNTVYLGSACSWNVVDTNNPIGATNTQAAATQNKSISVTTQDNDSYVLDCYGDNGTVNTAGAGQTRFDAGGGNRVTSYKPALVKGTNGTSWSGSNPPVAYSYVIVEIKSAFPAAVQSPVSQPLRYRQRSTGGLFLPVLPYPYPEDIAAFASGPWAPLPSRRHQAGELVFPVFFEEPVLLPDGIEAWAFGQTIIPRRAVFDASVVGTSEPVFVELGRGEWAVFSPRFGSWGRSITTLREIVTGP